MGIIKNAINKVVEEGARGIGEAAAVNILEASGEVLKATGKAIGIVSDKVSRVIDNHNMVGLKKEARKQDYCLFVSKEKKLGEGVYSVTNKKKEEKYNTLCDFKNKNFTIHLYSKQRGEIASVSRISSFARQFFSSDRDSADYLVSSDHYPSGKVFADSQGDQKIYLTDFNDWIITGEFRKGNYKIFDKTSGKTMATIIKRSAIASSYMIDCNYDKNEPIVVLLTILIDMIN